MALGTVLGVGRLPLVPGTFGSAVGLGLAWLIARLTAGPGPSEELTRTFLVTYILVNLAVAGTGVWAANLTVAYLRQKDPSCVVIDEVSGQLLSFAAVLPALAALNWKSLVLGFILFRGFDVLKPFPARRAEWLPGGWGVMTDDWLAGGYATLVLWAIRAWGIF